MRWEAGQRFVDRVRFSIVDEQKYRAFKQKLFKTKKHCQEQIKFIDPYNISVMHSKYGKIYYPFYNLSAQMGGGQSQSLQ